MIKFSVRPAAVVTSLVMRLRWLGIVIIILVLLMAVRLVKNFILQSYGLQNLGRLPLGLTSNSKMCVPV